MTIGERGKATSTIPLNARTRSGQSVVLRTAALIIGYAQSARREEMGARCIIEDFGR